MRRAPETLSGSASGVLERPGAPASVSVASAVSCVRACVRGVHVLVRRFHVDIYIFACFGSFCLFRQQTHLLSSKELDKITSMQSLHRKILKHCSVSATSSEASQPYSHNSAARLVAGKLPCLEASGRKCCVLGWFVAHGCRAWDRVYFGAKLSSIIYNYITCMVGGYRGSRLPGDTSTSTSRGIPTASATCF